MPECVACGRKILGKPALLSVFGQKLEFCGDSGGCRRTVAEAKIMEREREKMMRKPRRRANA